MNQLPPLDPEAESDVLAFPASAAQEAFFYLEKLFPSHPAFNVPVRFRLDGALDVALLKLALADLAERHESLRTAFMEEEGKLLQVIGTDTDLPLPVTDISNLSGAELETEIDRLGSIEARSSLDLAVAPLIRASLLLIAPDRYILQITIHHAVSDGWSIGIITDELAEFYNARLEDRESTLESLAVQYADFTIWQREFLESPELEPHLDYWKNRLAGYTELELPTDHPRPATKSWDGDIVSRILPSPLSEKVARIAREQGATMFHVFLAAFKAVASRYTGQDDIAVGSPVAGRTRAELEGIIGTFINSVILRTDLSGDPSFRTLVSRVRDTATEAITHQELPFEKLVKALQPRRDPGRNPLFQINFTHQRDFVRPVSFGGARLAAFPSRSPGAIFDLHFFMVERADGWRASCDFARDLFDRETAQRLLAHFETLLEAGTASPDQPLSSLPILTPEETLRLGDWSGNSPSYPSEQSLGELFLASAREHADRPALSHAGNQISYRDLANASLSLAETLRAAGVKPGDYVALCAPSVPEMIAAQLAILFAGAACVPLDPEYPADRLAYMLGDCAAPVILTTAALASRLPSATAKIILLEPITTGSGETGNWDRNENGNRNVEVPATAVSHVFYTSGSTGMPKGVMIRHRAISRLVHEAGFMNFGPDDSFLQAAPISFDAATLEIWMPLLHGGRVVLMGGAVTSLAGISRAVREESVTCLWLTAGLFQSMIEEHPDNLRGLKYLLAGGDVLSPAHVRRTLELLPDTQLINGYGPTENTTFTCCHAISAADLERASIPIGRPIGNTTVHILDAKLQPVPTGIPGELFTGGDGLSSGYLNQPELTAEKFIKGPFGSTLYRTGDLCRWLPDGTIEFLGRHDHQVKIRGFRIEIGEIETALSQHPAVGQVKVVARGADAASKKLLAWVTPAAGKTPVPAELREFLKDRLPAYMRPSAIGVIERFPLNANGKVETKGLPDPSLASAQSLSHPVTATEEKLVALWKELLERDQVGVEDEWFDLGGHSLLALRLFSRIHREFERSLPLSTLITHPTVRALAQVLDPAHSEDVAAPGEHAALVVTLNEGSLTPVFAVHGGDGATLFYRELATKLGDRPFYALESLQLNHSGPIEVTSIEETASAYIRVLRTKQARGPYCLAGYSFGGLVAWEMACQLTAAGDEVHFVALFDTLNPVAYGKYNSPLERVKSFWEQHADVPIAERTGRLAARFIEGTRTHFRVKRESSQAASNGPAEAHTDLRRVQLREAHDQAMQKYVPPAFPGATHLFKARFTGDKMEVPPDYGWSELSGKGLTILEVPGEHLTLFDPENVEEFAASLGQALKTSSPH